jgi:hypothetical protein
MQISPLQRYQRSDSEMDSYVIMAQHCSSDQLTNFSCCTVYLMQWKAHEYKTIPSLKILRFNLTPLKGVKMCLPK